MSSNKNDPTDIDSEIQAKATADLEAAVSKELSVDPEEAKAEEISPQALFSGGSVFGGAPYAHPHTVNGCDHEDCECKFDSKAKGHNWHEST